MVARVQRCKSLHMRRSLSILVMFLIVGGTPGEHGARHDPFPGRTASASSRLAASQERDVASLDNKLIGLTTACAMGGDVYISRDVYRPTNEIPCAAATYLHGAGINQTIIKPTSALSAALFSFTAASEGYKLSDLTIDMTDAPAQGAISLNHPIRPIFENVRIVYPSSGTGTALSAQNVRELHAREIIITNPGIGIDINGDGGAEHFYDSIVVESPATVGFRIRRTTTSDVGGYYLAAVKVTNPGNRNGQSFVFTSTVANTALPLFMVNCVGDNARGGDALSITNINLLQLTNNWFTNGAAEGANQASVSLSNVVQATFVNNHFQSNSRDVAVLGTSTSIFFDHNQFNGRAAHLYFDRVGVKSNIRAATSGNLFTGTLTNDFSQLDDSNDARPRLPFATPTGSSEICTPGQIWADATYVYVCVRSGSIKRVPLSNF